MTGMMDYRHLAPTIYDAPTVLDSVPVAAPDLRSVCPGNLIPCLQAFHASSGKKTTRAKKSRRRERTQEPINALCVLV